MTKTEFQREERYVVFKVSDLGNSLKGDEIRRLAREYAEHLEQLVKEPLDYVVIEAGWSEYAPTWKVIDVRVTGAQPAPSVPDGFVWPECPKRRQSHVLFDDGYEEGWAACISTVKAILAAATSHEENNGSI